MGPRRMAWIYAVVAIDFNYYEQVYNAVEWMDLQEF